MDKLHDIHRRIREKKVYLFGAGKMGESFYDANKDSLVIAGYFDNNAHAQIKDIPVTKPPFRTELGKEVYVIICSVHENEMVQQLIEMGYTPFVDFTNISLYEVYNSFLPEKKEVLFYGTCHTNAVMNVLLDIPEFSDNYNCMCIRVNTNKTMEVEAANILFEQADLVVFENYFGSLAYKKRFLFKKSISIPELFFWGYWPQADTKNFVNEFWEIGQKYGGHKDTLIYKPDIIINRLIREGRSEDEIMSLLFSNKLVSREKTIADLERNFKIIKVAEKTVDIKILDYFLVSYKKECIYKDLTHLGECLMREYAYRIMQALEIENFETVSKEKQLYPHTDVPIYPCVAEYLELEMIDEKTRYNIRETGSKDRLYSLTFEEYEREYIKRCNRLNKMFTE